MYGVTAMRDGRQVPVFYLCENAQGIVSHAQAERIAREVLGEGATGVCVVYLGKQCDPSTLFKGD